MLTHVTGNFLLFLLSSRKWFSLTVTIESAADTGHFGIACRTVSDYSELYGHTGYDILVAAISSPGTGNYKGQVGRFWRVKDLDLSVIPAFIEIHCISKCCFIICLCIPCERHNLPAL
jgi:hypothetical protein